MGKEVERKFLLRSDAWRDGVHRSIRLVQGYLARSEGSAGRVRIDGDTAELNIKHTLDGIDRLEFEYPIPLDDAREMLEQVAIFSASSLSQATIFGLGIMPYISASIIFQLLGSVWPKIAELQKEGEAGRKKINEYTRYATVIICLGQSYFWIRYLSGNMGGGDGPGLILEGYNTLPFHLVATITMTAMMPVTDQGKAVRFNASLCRGQSSPSE